MNISAPFILRPVATSLLALALLGWVAVLWLGSRRVDPGD